MKQLRHKSCWPFGSLKFSILTKVEACISDGLAGFHADRLDEALPGCVQVPVFLQLFRLSLRFYRVAKARLSNL